MRRMRERMNRPSVLSRPRTPAELLARLGRLVLWLTVGLLLARGAGDLLASEQPTTRPGVQQAGVRPAWPDDAARAFAVEFAIAYLSHAPDDDPGPYARRLAGFGSAQVAGGLVPRVDQQRPRQLVRSATVAGATTLDTRRALITVAAAVASGKAVRARYVTVPVARDRAGALAVYDLPSFVAAPARAAIGPAQGDPLYGSDRAPIEDVLARFLRAYLAGDTEGLAYLVPPGTPVPAAGGLELVELGSVVEAAPEAAGARERAVLVGVQARDVGSRATYALRYRVRLVRRDRWYVAGINGRGTGKR
jgi:hypothetical protein